LTATVAEKPPGAEHSTGIAAASSASHRGGVGARGEGLFAYSLCLFAFLAGCGARSGDTGGGAAGGAGTTGPSGSSGAGGGNTAGTAGMPGAGGGRLGGSGGTGDGTGGVTSAGGNSGAAGGAGSGGMRSVGGASGSGDAGVSTAGGQGGSATGGVTSASGGASAGGTGAGGAGGGAGSGAAGQAGANGGDCQNGGNSGAVTVIDSTVEKRSGFENGTIAPYQICTTKTPNYGQAAMLDGRAAMKFFWTQVGYDGTREKRGAEACSTLQFVKDGWYGFQFYLPSPGFPTDKTEGIAQIFSEGGCSSWAGMLQMRNNALWFVHRPACVNPTEVQLAAAVPRNTWNSVIVHFTASHETAGGIQIWFGDSTCTANAPTYSKLGINFGFGTWDGDQLAIGPSNTIGLKFGMYDFDDTNYTVGETRTLYYDNVTQLAGNPSNAWMLVNPSAAGP
jgi:Polysaccharide lyase